MKTVTNIFSLLFLCWYLLFDQQRNVQVVGATLKTRDIDSHQTHDLSARIKRSTNDTNSIQDVTIPSNQNETNDLPLDDNDDVIELNVGGQRITTLRSTLTAVPNSILASMFSKKDSSMWPPTDKSNAFFLDYNSAQFNHLLDQLRTIKRSSIVIPDEINITAPSNATKANFSLMIQDLGLNPERFLSPLWGVQRNLDTSSLVGWEECYRETYATPFDIELFRKMCRSRKVLVACRPVNETNSLTLAGVGQWHSIFYECAQNSYCVTKNTNGIGFYYAPNQAWGFERRLDDTSSANYQNQFGYHHYNQQNTINLSPCDSSDQSSEYRLCWSLRSQTNRGGGDRCGSTKYLHNVSSWERIIYRAISYYSG